MLDNREDCEWTTAGYARSKDARESIRRTVGVERTTQGGRERGTLMTRIRKPLTIDSGNLLTLMVIAGSGQEVRTPTDTGCSQLSTELRYDRIGSPGSLWWEKFPKGL